ncbi:MAG: OmpH family outer membrane protein [Nitrospirota bacterium]
MRLLKILCPLVLSILLIAGSVFAASKICFISIQQVIDESSAGKDAQTEMQKLRNEHQKILKQRVDELNKLNEEMKKLGSADQKAKRLQQDYQKKLREYNDLTVRLQKEARQKDVELTEKIAFKVRELAGKMAKEKGIDYVFERVGSSIIVFPSEGDITKEVINRYDEEYSGNK